MSRPFCDTVVEGSFLVLIIVFDNFWDILGQSEGRHRMSEWSPDEEKGSSGSHLNNSFLCFCVSRNLYQSEGRHRMFEWSPDEEKRSSEHALPWCSGI